MDIVQITTREILSFVGSPAETTYPTLARHWGILKQKSSKENKDAFGVLRTLIRFSKMSESLNTT